MSKSKTFLVLVLMVVLYACASVRAPQGTVPKRKNLVTDSYGGWIALKTISPPDSLAGEFIAYDQDTLYVMKGGSVLKYGETNISIARVIYFRTEQDAYAGWTLLASLLTVSNGYYAAFTFPVTLVTGIATTTGEAKRINYIDYPLHPLSDLSKYARFPQGMPEGINLSDLRPRPLPK